MMERQGLLFIQEKYDHEKSDQKKFNQSTMNEIYEVINKACETNTSLYQCYMSSNSDNDLYIYLFQNQKLTVHIEEFISKMNSIADFDTIDLISDKDDLQDFNDAYPPVPKEQSDLIIEDLDALTSNIASLTVDITAPSNDIERAISYTASSMRHIDNEKKYPVLSMLHSNNIIGTETVFARDQKHGESDFLVNTINIFRLNAGDLLYFEEIMGGGLEKLIADINVQAEEKSICIDHYSLCYALYKCSPEPFSDVVVKLPNESEKLIIHPKLYLFLYFIYMMGLARKAIDLNKSFLRNRKTRHIPAIKDIISQYNKDPKVKISISKTMREYLEMLNIDYDKEYLSKVDIQNLKFLLSFLEVTEGKNIENYFSQQIFLVFNLLFFNYYKNTPTKERERHSMYVKHPNTILKYFNFQTMGGNTYQNIQLSLPEPYLIFREIYPREQPPRHITD